ncbi:MAG: hypothetical protein ACLFVI_02315 [Archaeoglobaceae archaeon]
MDKHKLAREFYVLLYEAEGCPLTTRDKIQEGEYEEDELKYMLLLLNRWVEGEIVRGAGGRKMFAYLKLMKRI